MRRTWRETKEASCKPYAHQENEAQDGVTLTSAITISIGGSQRA